ncbi:uncharacterized protein AKAME5_000240800 [Lates japonicus]|uniref:Uncharacterized protein n=1 Tax=Lates japonicus TaxID=270547 RepID=A0AAD3QXW7_LATJO|nr:uncharacterized protein AKAME5_000240800 [Lates japonicus]
MDARSKHIKTGYLLRKTVKSASKLRWRLLRVSTEVDEEAGNPCRATAVRATIRKYLHREQKRAQLAKLAKVLRDVGKKEKKESMYEENTAAACVNRNPSGAMAPENTTQYLMSNVYEDMKSSNTQGTLRKRLACVAVTLDFPKRTNTKRRTGRCPPSKPGQVTPARTRDSAVRGAGDHGGRSSRD